jgi:FHA domain
MITCSVCQHSNIDGVMFCEKCGHELGSELERVSPDSDPVFLEPPTKMPLEFGDLETAPENFDASDLQDSGLPFVNSPISSTELVKAKLTAKSSEASGKSQEFMLDESPLLIGKFDPDTGVVDIDLIKFANAELISRNHAELSFDGENWQVTDLDSANGTYIKRGSERAFKITQTETLSDGDRLSFANIVFTFSLVPEII